VSSVDILIDKASRIAVSPSNWAGLTIATVIVVAKSLGLLGAEAWLLAPIGYLVAYGAVGLWLGFPRLDARGWEADLEFEDAGDARQGMSTALEGVRALVTANPDSRISKALQERILGLCSELRDLLDQWERSKGTLSLQEEFHARHIAISYLPEALKTYMSIPRQFASTRKLGNGQTAESTFIGTLEDMSRKVGQLGDDLAQKDASAFLSHSQFLADKFGKPQLEFGGKQQSAA